MPRCYIPILADPFVGRRDELAMLHSLARSPKAVILTIYGRRRIGKTELIEHAFARRKLLKFEGLEGARSTQQLRHLARQLVMYREDDEQSRSTKRGRSKSKKEPIAQQEPRDWVSFLQQLATHCATGGWTIYFEEVQWIAAHRSEFISALKFVWDNQLRRNKDLILILCGSSPSFMIKKVIRSRSLYNRSLHELALKPFSLGEASEFLGKRYSREEVLDGYLAVGGIPEYLSYLTRESSVLLSLATHAFRPEGFFVTEHERVFASTLGSNPLYRAIVNLLAHHRFLTREEIATKLSITLGGGLSRILEELSLCGFITILTSLKAASRSKSIRYTIADEYLQFYFRFIKPIEPRIKRGDFRTSPLTALPKQQWEIWLGYAFERWCRNHSHTIATILGFGAVQYESGPFFKRSSPGAQIDLIFERADRVTTVCEIKYSKRPVKKGVIDECEEKIEALDLSRRSVHRVLIAPGGVDTPLERAHYFDAIIGIEQLFGAAECR
jgi:AAA+ ATPase superfamily predicted ATPase